MSSSATSFVSATTDSAAMPASAASAASSSATSSSSSQRGPFLVFLADYRGCHSIDEVESRDFATESEFRTYLAGRMACIQYDYSKGRNDQEEDQEEEEEEDQLAAPTEEEVTAVVSGTISIDDAVRKIHAWNSLNSCGQRWRAVKEVVQPTSNNPRATIRDVGRRQ